MIAAISPADYDETLSTLRYADQAKKIKNKAVVNEDPNAKLIRELKEELTLLRSRIAGPAASSSSSPSSAGAAAGESTWDATVPASQQLVQYQTASGELRTISKAELQDQLDASERLMASVTETWEEKLDKTREVQVEREKALESLGIVIERGNVGVHTPKKVRRRSLPVTCLASEACCADGSCRSRAAAAPRQPVRGPAHGRVPHLCALSLPPAASVCQALTPRANHLQTRSSQARRPCVPGASSSSDPSSPR